MSSPIELIQKAELVVVKVGTRVLTTSSHELDQERIRSIVHDIAALKKAGKQVIFVSSGAIGAGMGVLGWTKRPKDLARSQAAAAVGQGRLMQLYASLFGKRKIQVAQVLLTRKDMSYRHRYLNARNTMRALLQEGVVPVVNENDTVSVDEIKFGDNDELSVIVAQLMDAQLLVNLTTVDGFEHRRSRKREVLPVVEKITPELEKSAEGTTGVTSTGGMVSKIKAAKMAMQTGIPMCLANGTRAGMLKSLVLDGHLACTLFLPKTKGRMASKKRWIGFTVAPSGALWVDAGARKALVQNNKSLLASGIKKVTGAFKAQELVSICNAKGVEFARGLAGLSADQLKEVQGLRSDAIVQKLGTSPEAVHRDDMVILEI